MKNNGSDQPVYLHSLIDTFVAVKFCSISSGAMLFAYKNLVEKSNKNEKIFMISLTNERRLIKIIRIGKSNN